MRENRGLSVIEILIVIVCVCAVVLLLGVALRPHGDPRRRLRCRGNLRHIAMAMNMYLVKYGGNSLYAVPANSFRGDCWLATLYWTDLIAEPKVFLCPATAEDNAGGADLRADEVEIMPGSSTCPPLNAAFIKPSAISYAGLCRGLAGRLAHRNTRHFSEASISSASALACDDNEGSPNHSDGINVVYFDSHVEFRAGLRSDTYDLVGARKSEFQYLDSGD